MNKNMKKMRNVVVIALIISVLFILTSFVVTGIITPYRVILLAVDAAMLVYFMMTRNLFEK